MPEDLLFLVESAAPIVGSLENIEDLVRVAVRQVGCAVEGMKGTARTFEDIWRRIIRHVAAGQTTEIQASRQRLLKAFEKRLDLLKQTHSLATQLYKPGKADIPNPDALLPDIEGMERLKARVFESWHTAEDLEDLASRDYPLTTDDLDQIGPRHQPPASYYAEESKPF
jgi:hypothetical protein